MKLYLAQITEFQLQKENNALYLVTEITKRKVTIGDIIAEYRNLDGSVINPEDIVLDTDLRLFSTVFAEKVGDQKITEVRGQSYWHRVYSDDYILCINKSGRPNSHNVWVCIDDAFNKCYKIAPDQPKNIPMLSSVVRTHE